MDKMLSMIQDFLHRESAGGICLMIAAALSLIIANSPVAEGYAALSSGWLRHATDDGLMVLFFLLVSLEIKRELAGGELSRPSQAVLPLLAALGGMSVPAGIYALFAMNEAGALAGWAIPSATDIAFSLAVLTMLGRRAPDSLKLFLTALAIIDDLGAIVVIALFYTQSLNWSALGLAALGLAALAVLNRRNVRAVWPYLLSGIWIWGWLLPSGIHATLAGVAVGLFMPANGGDDGPLCRTERGLHPYVAFAILPLFAFLNAGLNLWNLPAGVWVQAVPVGIMAALFLGKQAGVMGFSWVGIRLGLAKLPDGVGWRAFHGAAVLTGIGFTMSLFIGGLAFSAPVREAEVRSGVLAGSLASAVVGALLISAAARRRRNPPAELS
jgi:NhaA family Na+:H+ antiporter